MKALVKLFSLVVCMVLLCTTCNKIKPEPEEESYPLGLDRDTTIGFLYTEIVESNTNSYFQIGDSVYNFNSVEGLYYFDGYKNTNVFCLSFSDTLISGTFFRFEMFTEVIQPEVFFQKGIQKIDALRICCIGININSGNYKNIQSVFTWDTVYYEDKKFKGVGSLEIIDTLFTRHSMRYEPPREEDPDPYFPPQKIKFEFK